ncbi:MAG TPA: hypothetical protein VF053_13345 [Streptosporangiales bacterium]
MRRVPVLAAACAAAAAVLLLPNGVNAAPATSHHLEVTTVKPAKSELPAYHPKATRAAAETCDPPNDHIGPGLLGVSTTPVDIPVGVHDVKSFIYTAHVKDDCDIESVEIHSYRIDDSVTLDFALFYVLTESDGTQTWAAKIEIDPVADLANPAAGTWHSDVHPTDVNHNSSNTRGAVFYLQRWSQITNNASPEPVAKGRTITVSGKLSRANWDDYEYHGYANHPVTLQFRTPTGSYSDVKTIDTSSTGTLKTTVKAAQDGCFRFYFKGTTTTKPVKGVGDCVDVR